jgi:hypothetical protein
MSNYLAHHLVTAKAAADVIESKICDSEHLEASELCSLSSELSELMNTMQFLNQMKAVYDAKQPKIITN